jgi:hypothetical protein
MPLFTEEEVLWFQHYNTERILNYLHGYTIKGVDKATFSFNKSGFNVAGAKVSLIDNNTNRTFATSTISEEKNEIIFLEIPPGEYFLKSDDNRTNFDPNTLYDISEENNLFYLTTNELKINDTLTLNVNLNGVNNTKHIKFTFKNGENIVKGSTYDSLLILNNVLYGKYELVDWDCRIDLALVEPEDGKFIIDYNNCYPSTVGFEYY